MNKITTFLILLALVMATTSCNKNRIFSEQKDLPNRRWEKNNALVFNPEISDTSKSYNFYFSLRHVYGFQPAGFKIKVEMSVPSGQVMIKTFPISFFDNKKHLLSDCSGDYCDLETLIEEGYKFTETGKYQFKILYDMEAKAIPNIMQVGLIIGKK
jgi:gliding motility-associated lipoprotein GldH